MQIFFMLRHLVAEISRFKFDDYRVIRTGASDQKNFLGGVYASVNWVSIGSRNSSSPGRSQAITRTNADLLSIGPLETNFSEVLIEILSFLFKETRWKMWSAKQRPLRSGGDELI